ncbi:glutathione synthetase ATP-binding domain-like protein [Athelia psychrophila]|uniref:Glutathione synthetase ATP-binding domain-like protein n=1 Tax=Athelia psychrophila TaxID=1759441 RepID=A0A166R5P8_9AGAM|nr:glutathione synthetase ATP-binding domain-like protein [Fibularhizoctonia sp. CBS 109695]
MSYRPWQNLRHKDLGWSTVAIYTAQDTSHTTFVDEAVKLDDVPWLTSPERIIDVAKRIRSTPPRLRLPQRKLRARLLLSSPTRTTKWRPGRARHTCKIGSGCSGVCRGWSQISGDAQEGGHGIRVVSGEADVEEVFKRCIGESPSGQLFAEKALSGPGWEDVEVQIVGDGTGDVVHLWHPRNIVDLLLAASMKIARALRYQGVGTFEYLVNSHTGQRVFLEINPRVQVGHTATEDIINLDLLCGQSVRENGGTDFDSLLAKILVRERRAVRALRETSIGNEKDTGVVKTNKAVLAGVVAHADWGKGRCDTVWLERELGDVRCDEDWEGGA